MASSSENCAASGILRALLLAGGAVLVRDLVRQRRRIDLDNKRVLITGGSRGLGLALAQEFARRGARISLCARNNDDLAAAAEILKRQGADVQIRPCDLRDPEQIRHLIHTVETTHGPIDVLVNNAGTISVGPVETMTEEDFHEAMDVHFWSVLHTTLAALPNMKARRFGRIVNIASIGGIVPVPHLVPYCASKFALVGFSTALRTELAKDGVLVTTISPGLMRTGSPRNAKFKGNHKAEYAWFSVSDSLPGVSMSAARAARRIVEATIFGEAQVVLGLPPKMAAVLFGIAPSLTLETLALTARLFPRGSGSEPHLGSESESGITRSALRALGHRAEKQFNQL